MMRYADNYKDSSYVMRASIISHRQHKVMALLGPWALTALLDSSCFSNENSLEADDMSVSVPFTDILLQEKTSKQHDGDTHKISPGALCMPRPRHLSALQLLKPSEPMIKNIVQHSKELSTPIGRLHPMSFDAAFLTTYSKSCSRHGPTAWYTWKSQASSCQFTSL